MKKKNRLLPEVADSILPSLAVEHRSQHRGSWSPFVPSPATISGPPRDDGRQQGRNPGMPPERRKENSETEGRRQRGHRKGKEREMERQERHRVGEEREKDREEKNRKSGTSTQPPTPLLANPEPKRGSSVPKKGKGNKKKRKRKGKAAQGKGRRKFQYPSWREERLLNDMRRLFYSSFPPPSAVLPFVASPVPVPVAAQDSDVLKKLLVELREIKEMLSRMETQVDPPLVVVSAPQPPTDSAPVLDRVVPPELTPNKDHSPVRTRTPSPALDRAKALSPVPSSAGPPEREMSGPTQTEKVPSECPIVKTKVPKKAKTRTSKTSSGSTGLFHNWNQWKKTVVAGEGGKDAKHFLNKELLWTVLFGFLLFLMYCIMTLLPLYLIVTPLVGLTGIYFREILWGAGVHTAAAVRTKWKSLPPQSVEHGTSDIGPKVEGREAANFRGQKSIVSGSPVESIHAEGTLSEHKGGDTPPPPNFRSPSPNLPVRGPRPWMV